MGNSNGRITAPVSLHADIYPVLGITKSGTYYDTGYACGNSHGRINKWAKYKPVRVGIPEEITDEQRTSANHGLSAVEVADIVKAQGGTLVALPATAAWSYAAPRPGTDWCRITDFIGYNHAARVPVSGFADIEIYSDQTASLPTYSFNCKFGPASYEGTGDTNGIEIALNDLAIIAGSNIRDGHWRLGLAIFVPQSNGATTYTAVVASHEAALGAISSSADIAKYIVNLGLSQDVRTALERAFTLNLSNVVAIPCICYDLDWVDSSQSFDFLGGGRAFCMPGGEKINIVLRKVEDSFTVRISSGNITYQNVQSGPYSLNPGGISPLRKPSAANGDSCRIQYDFFVELTGNHVPKIEGVTPGLGGAFVNNTTQVTYEKFTGSTWQTITRDELSGAGRYRVTATDSYSGGGTRTPVMQLLERLPTYTGASGTNPSLSMDLRFRIAGNDYVKSAGGTEMRMSAN